jgi:hypothetical protein
LSTRYACAIAWLEPALVDIVVNGASSEVTVIHEVWRIGEDEIDAVRWHLLHDLDAVAVIEFGNLA